MPDAGVSPNRRILDVCDISHYAAGSLAFNPIWTGLFANLKRLGGAKWPPPNSAISSQMTMKLVRIYYG